MDVARALSPASFVLSAFAVFLVFVGERVVGEGTARFVLDGLGAAVLLAALAWKARAHAVPAPAAKKMVRQDLAALVAVAAGLGLYAASQAVGEKDRAGALLVVALVVVALGLAAAGAIALVAAPMRRAGFVEPHRAAAATTWALGTTLALAALALSNYAADALDWRKDFSFGAPTAPSGATRSMLEATKCAPEVTLFFERGSTALPEIEDYFAALSSGGKVPVTRIDQAIDPALAKKLKVSRNGTVAFTCGERTETYYVGDDREAAHRKIAKLDEEVRTRLAKLTRDPKTVYFTTGHGERGLDEADRDKRPAANRMKKLIEAMNAKSKKLGIAEGLGRAVPDDAALVVVHGPTSAFLPEEAATIARFAEAGGSLLLLLDPGAEHGLQSVLDALGAKLPGVELANDKEFVRQSYTDADRAFLFSSSFGSHKSVKTLNSAGRGKAALLFLSAGAVEKVGDAKHAAIARTRSGTWPDADGDRAFDEGAEKKGVYDFAAAIEKPTADGKETRAIVVGDSDVLSDLLLANEANAVFGYEATLWLLRDDDAASGDLELSEDVKIRHTREEDALWFYGTMFAAPLLVLVGGLAYVRRKRGRRTR